MLMMQMTLLVSEVQVHTAGKSYSLVRTRGQEKNNGEGEEEKSQALPTGDWQKVGNNCKLWGIVTCQRMKATLLSKKFSIKSLLTVVRLQMLRIGQEE